MSTHAVFLSIRYLIIVVMSNNSEESLTALCIENIVQLLHYRTYTAIEAVSYGKIEYGWSCLDRDGQSTLCLLLIGKKLPPKDVHKNLKAVISKYSNYIIVHNNTHVFVKSIKQYLDKPDPKTVEQIETRFVLFRYPDHESVDEAVLVAKDDSEYHL